MLATSGLSAIAGSAENRSAPSMRFEWHREGPAALCGDTCRAWISGVGPITDQTPADFQAFAGGKDLHAATLVLDSEGGAVVETLEFGRTLRRLGITTSVGKTLTAAVADGGLKTTLSGAASCESMCVFLLLGGERRYVPAEAHVLIHQIWLTKKSKGAEKASYTADDLVVVERDIGRLARYTVEMGGGIELLEKALQVPPWEPLYRLSGDEVRSMGLSNVDQLFTSELRNAAAAPAALPYLARTLPAPHASD
jgi:hypothetical protein